MELAKTLKYAINFPQNQISPKVAHAFSNIAVFFPGLNKLGHHVCEMAKLLNLKNKANKNEAGYSLYVQEHLGKFIFPVESKPITADPKIMPAIQRSREYKV